MISDWVFTFRFVNATATGCRISDPLGDIQLCCAYELSTRAATSRNP